MSYKKLAGQKDKPSKTNMANQLSVAQLKKMLDASSTRNKHKDHIRRELQRRGAV